MGYLLTQIFLYMLATFLLGLLLGWLIWRYRDEAAPAETGDAAALRQERDRLAADLSTEREGAAALRVELAQRKAALETCEARCAALEAAPSVAAPAPASVLASVPPAADVGTKPQGITGPRGGQADDLQRISGVGPKLEQLLHDLGFYHFDQIAAWTEAEVAWVDQNLEGFYGRVTRDRWIEQARDLARGL